MNQVTPLLPESNSIQLSELMLQEHGHSLVCVRSKELLFLMK